MNKIVYLNIVILISFFSCKKDEQSILPKEEDSIVEQVVTIEKEKKIISYSPFILQPSAFFLNFFSRDKEVFDSEKNPRLKQFVDLEYDNQNRIIKRTGALLNSANGTFFTKNIHQEIRYPSKEKIIIENFDNGGSFTFNIQSIVTLFLDEKGRIIKKIIENKEISHTEGESLVSENPRNRFITEYKYNSSGLLVYSEKREEIFRRKFNFETQSFEGDGKFVTSNSSRISNNYKYNSDGNLIRKTEKRFNIFQEENNRKFINDIIVFTYSDYDERKNPWKGLRIFGDIFEISFSKNTSCRINIKSYFSLSEKDQHREVEDLEPTFDTSNNENINEVSFTWKIKYNEDNLNEARLEFDLKNTVK